jgi:hypothetical protein
MAQLFRTPWTLFAFSSVIAVATGVAIIGFGAPQQVIVPVTYATAAVGAVLGDWAHRQSRHR